MTKKRKRSPKPPPPPPPPEPPKIDSRFWLPDHLKEWVDLRSKPKKLIIKRKRRKLTRFQKNGPMKQGRFKKWYRKQMVILQKVYEKTLMLAQKVEKEKYKVRRRRRPIVEYIDWDRLEELAWPKWFREKYESPMEEIFPYSPKIFNDKPAIKGKARPFIKKQIPPVFMHEILEMDFWYEYRFPVNKDALKFKPTSREIRLSTPKTVPPDTQLSDGPPTRKMTKSQWLRYSEYLNFFASAKSKMYPRQRQPKPERGEKVCLKSLQSFLERLSIPKKRCDPPEKDLTYISEAAKNAKPSKAIERLAKPKIRLDNGSSLDEPNEKPNKSGHPSKRRMKELAVPKVHHSLPEKGPWKPLVTRKNKSQFSYRCSKRERFCFNYNNL